MDPDKVFFFNDTATTEIYTEFGDWYLAMAAYNCGPGCVESAVRRTGYADFWELSSHSALPKQTINYVPLIVALTIMAKNPKDYNLEQLDLDQPLEYDTIDIDSPTHLGLIADATERPVSEIQDLNPALLKPIAPAGYQLRVPKGTSASVRTVLATVPASHRSSWRIHRVTSGETLAEIARHYSTAASSISAANNRMAGPPEPGDLLVIPAAYQTPRVVAHQQARAPHRRATRRVVAAHPAPAPRTVSVALKHRPTAN
jgi:membrane-bound lytic murein transglycosylase D